MTHFDDESMFVCICSLTTCTYPMCADVLQYTDWLCS